MKILKHHFLFFMLLYHSNIAACTISTSDAEFTKNNPLSSPFVALASIEIRPNHEAALILSEGWGNYKKEYPMNTTSCPLGGESYIKKYLFVAKKNFDKESITQIDLSSGSLIPLNKAKAMMQILSKRNDYAGAVNPAWRFCEKESDCIEIKDNCSHVDFINVEYRKDLKNLRGKELSIKSACGKYKETKNGSSQCIENFCAGM